MKLVVEAVAYDAGIPEPWWRLFRCGLQRGDAHWWMLLVSGRSFKRGRAWRITIEPAR